MSLVKDTKEVTAVFNGLPISADIVDDLVCRIEAVNGNYTFNNDLTGENRRLTYLPQVRTDFTEDPVISFDFVTMRLFADNECQSRLILEYYPDEGGTIMQLLDVRLTDAIKVMYENADFDRQSVYELVFEASDMGETTGDYTFADVTINIKGWNVTESPGGITW
jgi:hypothetical protein